MYSVKHAAALTGISPATLRMWERRYEVVVPARSESGYRVYDDAALQRLSAMHALVTAGWSPRLAAERVKSGTTPGPALGPEDEGWTDAPAGPVVGDVDALARLAADFDGVALEAALDQAFARGSFEEVVDGWLMPALQRLGSAWHAGDVTVAGEHFVSATVHRRLAAVFDAAPARPDAARVLVGLSRGSRHELGILAFAAALRRGGLDVVYVGGDLPPESWVVSVVANRPAAVVIGVPSSDDIPMVKDTVAALGAAAPSLRVYLGGRHQDRVGDGVPLGHFVGAAARTVADEVSRTDR